MVKPIITEQYKLERKYHFLLISEKSEKKNNELYKEAYDEIYKFFNKHHSKKKSFGSIKNSHKLYENIFKNKICVDYGCGYGQFTKKISVITKKVYGIDASEEIIEKNHKYKKKNIEFMCVQSMKLPFKSNSVDSFYSTGVLEHLHPDDALKHLKEVHRCLRKGGIYVLTTPNKLFGPSDVSKYFLKRGSTAKGLHLKEYTYSNLYKILDDIKFKTIKTPIILEHFLLFLGIPQIFSKILTKSRYKIFLEKMLKKSPKFIAEILRVRGISFVITK